MMIDRLKRLHKPQKVLRQNQLRNSQNVSNANIFHRSYRRQGLS